MLPPCFRNCWMEDEDGEGGKCEKSELCIRRGWCASPWLDDDEPCRECRTLTERVSLLRSFTFSFGVTCDGIPTPRLL